MFDHVRRELTEHFGGVTAFLRSPAVGLWADPTGEIRRDDLALFEVMADSLDRAWWQGYRQQLELRFGQDKIAMRALAIDVL
jgi:hypothetical protein